MSHHDAARVFRLLVIEDDPGRIEILRSWLPERIKVVVAPSAGAAIGILKRDKGNVYGAIMLDHDLQERAMTSMDKALSGTDVTQTIIEMISPDVPVFIHSMNTFGSAYMESLLQKAGFEITRIPFRDLDREKFPRWLEEVYSLWEDAF